MIVPAQRWVKYLDTRDGVYSAPSFGSTTLVQGDVGCRSLLLAERAHRTHHIYRKAVLVQARSERPISPHRGGENERALEGAFDIGIASGGWASDRQG